jgi:cation transport ATPase
VPPEPRNARLESDNLEQLIELKRFYGRWILVTMAVQLIVVNAVFLLYAALGYDWAPPAGVVQVWLAATFVQVVSVVVVIARSLFPHEDSGRKRV